MDGINKVITPEIPNGDGIATGIPDGDGIASIPGGNIGGGCSNIGPGSGD